MLRNKHLRILTAVLALAAFTPVMGQRSQVLLETTEGNILLTLYDDTPRHRDNFLRLADEHFYEYKSVERTTERVYRNLFYLFLGLSVLQSGFIVVMTYLIRKVVNNRANPRPKRV